MGIASNHLRLYVIRPLLKKIGLWSESAENLLLGTAAQESSLGMYLHQINGPALGIYQIEPATHLDIWLNFLDFRPALKIVMQNLVSKKFSLQNPSSELIGNLYYSTAIARIIYFRAPFKLPRASDIAGLAEYWKIHYNTSLGRGTVEEFIKNYNRQILDRS